MKEKQKCALNATTKRELTDFWHFVAAGGSRPGNHHGAHRCAPLALLCFLARAVPFVESVTIAIIY